MPSNCAVPSCGAMIRGEVADAPTGWDVVMEFRRIQVGSRVRGVITGDLRGKGRTGPVPTRSVLVMEFRGNIVDFNNPQVLK